MDWKQKRSLSHFHFISFFSAPAPFSPLSNLNPRIHLSLSLKLTANLISTHVLPRLWLHVNRTSGGRREANIVMGKRWWGRGGGETGVAGLARNSLESLPAKTAKL